MPALLSAASAKRSKVKVQRAKQCTTSSSGQWPVGGASVRIIESSVTKFTGAIATYVASTYVRTSSYMSVKRWIIGQDY